MHYNTGCGCRCSNPCNTNPCQTCNQNCVAPTQADIRPLFYIKGLDENNCPALALPGDVAGLIDCEGEDIGQGDAVVTCDGLQDALCEVLDALPVSGPAVVGTELVGTECEAYTFPAFQAPLTVTDTSTVDHTLAGNNLSSVVRVSDDAGQIIEVRADGIYADIDAEDLCDAFADLDAGAAVTTGTVLLGADCLTHAMPDFQEQLTFVDTTTIDFTVVGNTVEADAIISPNAGNALIDDGDGLYVPVTAATPIVPVDTNSVNLTVSGGDGHTLQADVRLDPDVDNNIEINPGGLFFSLCDTIGDLPVAGAATPGVTEFVGADCEIYTLPAAAGTLTVGDTLTVDHTLVANNLTSDVRISAIADNLITIRPDGLAVRESDLPAGIATVSALDTDCINTTVNQVGNAVTISADPIISPAAGNIITCTAAGLYAAGTGEDITCENVVAVFDATGDVVTPGTVILAADCNTYEFPSFSAVDTNSINGTVAPDINNNWQFSGDVRVDPTYPGYTGTGLVVGADGVSAPPDTDKNLGEISTGGNFIEGVAMIEGQVITSALMTLNITNPSTVRDALLTINLYIPGINFTPTGTLAGNYVEVEVLHAFNLPAVSVTVLNTYTIFSINGNNTNRAGSPPAERSFNFTVPAGFSGSYQAQVAVTMASGTTSGLTAGRVGANYTLSAI